ncbi:MAG: YncE family protein [Polyangiaceae bacterium]
MTQRPRAARRAVVTGVVASIATALAIVTSTACTSETPAPTVTYAPYDGVAYPATRSPVAVPEGGAFLVTDSRSDTLSFVGVASGDRFATLPVGRDPVTIDGPHHAALDRAGGFLYVALSYPSISGATGPHAAHASSIVPGWVQKLSLPTFRPVGQTRVDANPGDIVVSEDGKRVVVSHFDLPRALTFTKDPEGAKATLAVIDPTTMPATGSGPSTKIPTCLAPHGVVLSKPDGAKAFVACYGEDAIAVVDLADPAHAVERIAVDGSTFRGTVSYGPYALVLSPDGTTLAVSSTESKDVRFFDVASRTFDASRTLKTEGAPYFTWWSEDGKELFVPTQTPDALLRVDTTDKNRVVASARFDARCGKPHVVTTDATRAFVVCEGNYVDPGTLVVLDRTTLAVTKATPLGVYPDSITLLTGGAP